MTTESTIVDPVESQTFEQELEEMQAESDARTEEALVEETPSEEVTSEEASSEQPSEEPIEEPPKDAAAALVSANEQIAKLTNEADERKQSAELQQLDTYVRGYAGQYAKDLVDNQGYDEKSANALAEAEYRAHMAEQQASIARKTSLADRLSREHGVSVASLMNYNSVEEMTAAATQMGPDKRRIDNLEAELKTIKKSGIPAQQYSQPAGRRAASSDERALDQYIAGSRTTEAVAAGKRAAGLSG